MRKKIAIITSILFFLDRLRRECDGAVGGFNHSKGRIMNHAKAFPSLFKVLTLSILLLAFASTGFAKKYSIQFGGTQGPSYFPNSLDVFVGDTIQWIGPFSQYSLRSTDVPAYVLPFGPIDTGTSFSYIIRAAGTYSYQSDKYASIGMTGSFTAVGHPPLGLTNEGREFFLGIIYPSYYTNSFNYSLSAFLNCYAFVTSYYANDISVSYYDESGAETGQTYHILPKSTIKIPLVISRMRFDTAAPGQPAFKSCHITSRLPVAVQYLSTGTCSGGSYLALPVMGLGKKYVVASYNDNPGNGSFISANSAASTFENSSGVFIVIGTENGTTVKITPAATTTDGHIGVYTGAGSNGIPRPYSITLDKGQCYQARSDGKDESSDLSGSLIEASKPIALISGHENAFLGSTDDYGLNDIEGRDLMIEQMIPVEIWDSVGFVSIPIAEAFPPGTYGHGDSYRIYAYDTVTAKVHADIQGISGGYDFNASRFNSPIPERLDVISPVDIYTTNGHKISIMQYDERSQSKKLPIPAPSMMTVIPISRWRTSYDFTIPDFDLPTILDVPFINVISAQMDKIMYTVNGTGPKPLSSLTSSGSFTGISSTYNVKGSRYKITSGSYYMYSDFPFIVYNYSMRELAADPSRLGMNNSLDYNFEYSAPSGIQLSTALQTNFIIDTTLHCSSWHVCVKDTGKVNPGIKAIMLIDDPDGAYFSQGSKDSNVNFDVTSVGYADGELHPNVTGSAAYCFDINIVNPLLPASAPIEIVDNGGNVAIVRLNFNNPTLKLFTVPPSSRPDSIVFPVKKIGEQICTTFVFKNTAPKGGTPLNLSSALLTNKDTSYKIQSIIPSLPHALAAQDSLTLQVCYTPVDSSRHRDSLVVRTDCFSFAISLDAHGSTGLISAADLDFGTINAGDTLCKNVQIKNVGTAPFTLTKSFILSDAIIFTVDTTKLPVLIPAGGSVQINICFHPNQEGPYSAGIDWETDLEASFAHSIKSHTSLRGNATPKAGVKMQRVIDQLSISPNPVNGNFVIVYNAPPNLLHLTVTNILGESIIELPHPNAPEFTLDLSKLPPGTYFARFTMANEVVTRKILKE